MKTGLCIPRPRFPRKVQWDQCIAAGVPEGRIYVAGENGEKPEDAFRAARDKIVHCPDGFRVFGTSQKAIREALIAAERRGVVIVDAATGQRSDKEPWKMYDLAVGRGRIEERRIDRRAMRKGGNTRAAKLEADRLPKEQAEPIWKNVKRFATDQDACNWMNTRQVPQVSKGWNPQLARRHFGPSGRPRGKRSEKPAKG